MKMKGVDWGGSCILTDIRYQMIDLNLKSLDENSQVYITPNMVLRILYSVINHFIDS